MTKEIKELRDRVNALEVKTSDFVQKNGKSCSKITANEHQFTKKDEKIFHPKPFLLGAITGVILGMVVAKTTAAAH